MEDKKLHILQNAGKLYLKFGIRSVTMDDVAREFGISKKTLYTYFDGKENMVGQVIDFYLNKPDFNLSKKCPGNAIDHFFEIRKHVIRTLKYFNNNLEYDLKKLYPELYKKVHTFKRERIYSNTVKNFVDGVKEGLYRSELDPVMVAKLQVGRMLYSLNPDNEVFSETELSSIELFDKIIDYHMHAICTEKGIKYFKEQLNKIQNEENS
ncbi:MAG TPA: TetR/AcrR family transcriptional regulator [Draconibacterium sp.]|nr:TetR/AcrR family transcriptional regulator [Draconibacterium sp.]